MTGIKVETLLAQLSTEDRERYWTDLLCYGRAVIYWRHDGSVELLDPMQMYEQVSVNVPIDDGLDEIRRYGT